jgi:hypothetical protein
MDADSNHCEGAELARRLTAERSGPNRRPSPFQAQSNASIRRLEEIAAEKDACYKRPAASGDIYVRMVTPGVSPQAQQLGGEWGWDSVTQNA